jgi:kinetochore protein Mis13/DSN1
VLLTHLLFSLAAYDEDIEGFQFAFATKKPKPSSAEEVVVPEPIVEVTQQQSPKRGRPPKTKPNKVTGAEDTAINGSATRKRPGRPKRVSAEILKEPERNRRSTRARDEEDPSPMENSRKKGRPGKSKTPEANGFLSPEPTQAGTSKIALPFADTPVIRRNKEMREERAGKGQRRSSLGMRGRRASSLIESGASNGGEILPQTTASPENERGADAFRTALPHKEVATSEFYKHIASEGLSEPRRMKQLLTWCATRALSDKPSGSRSVDDSARLAGE